MRSASRLSLFLVSLSILLCCFHAPAAADWDPGDPYKMHYPQLPDPEGWDVNVTGNVVADDWLCTETGPVTSIHLWYSVQGREHDPAATPPITNIHLSIHKNIPKTDNDFSKPGDLLWEADLNKGQFNATGRFYGQGTQGWIEPGEGFLENDHDVFYQVNVSGFTIEPFRQEVGTIYWLDVSVEVENDPNEAPWLVGWKTSLNHFEDDAVYRDASGAWQELYDPLTEDPRVSLDMAFVIVPEPTSCIILGIGLCGLFVVVRRTRKFA